jgi:hypothetical protein
MAIGGNASHHLFIAFRQSRLIEVLQKEIQLEIAGTLAKLKDELTSSRVRRYSRCLIAKISG